MTVALAETWDDLQPYLKQIFEIIKNAVEAYKGVGDEQRAIIGATTRACYIHDYMKHYAYERLQNIDGIRCILRGHQFLIIIKEKYRIRLKKLDKHLRPSNYPTARALSYLNQDQSTFVIPDAPPPVTDLIAGYQWDIWEAGYGVWIVCPKGRSNEWQLEIQGGGDAAGQAILSSLPTPPGPTSRPRRVSPKTTPAQKGTGESDNA